MRGSLGAAAPGAEPVTVKLGCVTRPGSCQDATPGPVRVQPSGRSVTS